MSTPPPQTIAYPAPGSRARTDVERVDPHVLVLFGATGDLARRKLLPGMAHLVQSSLAPDIRIVGTSLEAMSTEEFAAFARRSAEEFGIHGIDEAGWDDFASRLTYLPTDAGAAALADTVRTVEAQLGPDARRLHYLSVPPQAALAVIDMLREADLDEEKNKVFRSLLPIDPADVVRGQFAGYRDLPGVASDSDTETFIAMRCGLDNWRWAGVPFYLRTGKCMAEGARIISIAFREAPRSMFPPNSGVGKAGPDHLTFDLAEDSKVSLSYYGKRPGPGMKLDKLSMQFSAHESGHAADVLEAYERLILDAMRGDHTLFTTAEGIESLWARSEPLLADPSPAKPYAPGTWGPNAIHQLVAPHAWRLPFERAWRE